MGTWKSIQVGERIGNAVIVRQLEGESSKTKSKVWLLRCDCGREFQRRSPEVRRYGNFACSCRRVVQAGKKYGSYTTVSIDSTYLRNYDGALLRRWLVQCECGKRVIRSEERLASAARNGGNCGCRRRVALIWARTEHVPGAYWARLQRDAKAGKRKVSVSIEDLEQLFLKQKGKCALSGIELTIGRNGTASLDRIDSGRGYEKGNIQWLHKTINKMKTDLPQATFIAMCSAVRRNLFQEKT